MLCPYTERLSQCAAIVVKGFELDRTNRITKFGLSNFKSFHYLEDIELRPLTVLVGANSAGKSSLLQSILLLKQSSYDDRSGNILRFNGHLTDLGNFENIISNFDTSRELEYRFTVEFTVPAGNLLTGFPHLQDSANNRNALVGVAHVYIRFVSQVSTRAVALQCFEITSFVPEIMSEEQGIRLVYNGEGQTLEAKNLPPMPLLPRKRVPELDCLQLVGFWPDSFIVMPQRRVSSKTQKVSSFNLPIGYAPALSIPISILQNVLTEQLEYVGPVRADPRPFYPVEETPEIGLRGETTVPYLLRHQHDVVKYVPAPMQEVYEGTLLEATNHWLRRMKVTDQLTINPVEAIAYVAAIKSPYVTRNSVNLSQVGFGVSQILSVLVAGLQGPDDKTLLLEQPEIHLHPRLQAQLAEFLLCVVQTGKTVIVETHSDHLINRLRRCIAEDETGTLADMVSILFVHPGTEENPSSYVEALEIDETGNIVNWPPDFLSEAANESLAILRASQQKKFATKP